jgi:hypothetical protein
MAAKISLYESFLKDLLPTQDPDIQQTIQKLLAEASPTFSELNMS